MAANALPLARIAPARREVASAQRPAPRALSAREKAAVIVRFLLGEGAALPLSQLPEHMQSALAEQMAAMRLVDRATLDAVLGEFAGAVESVGLAFPGGLEGALQVMDGHISQTAASRLRRKAGVGAKGDPWERLVTLPPDRILPVLADESVEVAAVVLSKLPVPRAAELLGRLPGERARRIAFAISMTGNVDPETVRRIGLSILGQIDSLPPRAFDRQPGERVGAILNVSPSATRDDVLTGLEAEDAGFAAEVRRAIFTYAHIPLRIAPRDVPKIIRAAEQATVVTAMAWSQGRDGVDAATEFLLTHMSQRLAQTLREDMATRGKVADKDAEAAMNQIVTAIRTLEGAGEVVLLVTEGAE